MRVDCWLDRLGLALDDLPWLLMVDVLVAGEAVENLVPWLLTLEERTELDPVCEETWDEIRVDVR